eukprot:4578803-Prymnesium_polylepis.2
MVSCTRARAVRELCLHGGGFLRQALRALHWYRRLVRPGSPLHGAAARPLRTSSDAPAAGRQCPTELGLTADRVRRHPRSVAGKQ